MSKNDSQFPEQDYCRVYIGRMSPLLKGKRCRIITTWRRYGPHNVLVEFENGRRIICPLRCLDKA